MKQLLALLTLAFALTAGVSAQPSAQRLTVEQPWVRLNAPGAQATGAFMVLGNVGGKALKIVRAESPVAQVTELHDHINDGGVMKMRAIPALIIPAGEKATLKPGSLHVMLIDLKAPLKEGDQVPITLFFEDDSRTTIEAPVRKMLAPGQGGH